jgi:Flp pilus assembly pilin Flp
LRFSARARIRSGVASLGVNLRSLPASRSGATAIEYGLIAAIIVLVLIPLHNSIGNSVKGFFMSVANGL